ncbi:MAG: M50 family metallopeptidase [Actinomycetota bacterium]
MLKIFAKISMVLFLIAVPFLFYGFGGETLRTIAKISFKDSRWLAFLAGLVIFFPCLFIAKRLFLSAWNYLETLEHELTHLLIGLLFLKIPVGIRVSAHEGGEVRQIGRGTTGQTWISLAPYFFPTISLVVLIVAYFIDLSPKIFLAVLGWTTAFHLVTNWSETSFRQPDLQKAGILKTILILPVMNLISYGSILAFVADGRRGFGSFWFEGFKGAFNLVSEIWRRII